jgi:PAS domain-containing protein
VTEAASDLVYLRALFDRLPTAVLIANDAAIYVGANLPACQLLERPREQVVGLHLSDIVAPGRRREVDVQWQAFLRDGIQSGVIDLDLPSGRRAVHFHAQAHFVPGLHCSFLTPQPMALAEANTKSPLLTVCAWSKQVLHDGRWMPLEQFLHERLGSQVTHGMSPAVFERLTGEIDGGSAPR